MDIIKNLKKMKNDNNIILAIQKDYYLYKDLKLKSPIIQFFENPSQNLKKNQTFMEQNEHRKTQPNFREIYSLDNKNTYDKNDEKSRNVSKKLSNDNFNYTSYITNLNNNNVLPIKKFSKKIDYINDNEKVISKKTINNEYDFENNSNFRKTENILKNKAKKANKFNSLEKTRKTFNTNKLYNDLYKNKQKTNKTNFPSPEYGNNNPKIIKFLNKTKNYNNSNTNSTKKQKIIPNKKSRYQPNKTQQMYSEENKKCINIKLDDYNNEKNIFNDFDKKLPYSTNYTLEDNLNDNPINNRNFITNSNNLINNNQSISQNSKYLYSVTNTTELPKLSISDIKPLFATKENLKLKCRRNSVSFVRNGKMTKLPISLNKNKAPPVLNSPSNENDVENSNGCRKEDMENNINKEDITTTIFNLEENKNINVNNINNINNNINNNIIIDNNNKIILNNFEDKKRNQRDSIINPERTLDETTTNLNGTNNDVSEGIINCFKGFQHLKNDNEKVIKNNKIHHDYTIKYKNYENDYYKKSIYKINNNLELIFRKNKGNQKKNKLQRKANTFINNKINTYTKDNNDKKNKIREYYTKYNQSILKKSKYFKGFLEPTLISYFSYKILQNINIHTIKITFKEQVQYSNDHYFDILPLMVRKMSIDWHFPETVNLCEKVNILSLTKNSKYNFNLLTEDEIIGGKSCSAENIIAILKIFKECTYLDLKQRLINRILTDDIIHVLNSENKPAPRQKKVIINSRKRGSKRSALVNRSFKRMKKRTPTIFPANRKTDISFSSDKFSAKASNSDKKSSFANRIFASCTKLRQKKFDSDENEESKKEESPQNVKYSKFKKCEKGKKDMAIILSSTKKVTDMIDNNNNNESILNNENNEVNININDFFETSNKLNNINLLTNKHIFNQNKKIVKCGTLQRVFQQVIKDNKNEKSIKKKLKNDTMIIKCAGYDMLTKEASLIKTQEIEEDLPISKKFDRYVHYIKSGKLHLCLQMLKEEKNVDIFKKQEISTGNTLLNFAVQYNIKSIVHELLAKGSNPNIPNKFGNTALHLAYKNNHSIIINELMMYNASEKLKNNQGLYPWQMSDLN